MLYTEANLTASAALATTSQSITNREGSVPVTHFTHRVVRPDGALAVVNAPEAAIAPLLRTMAPRPRPIYDVFGGHAWKRTLDIVMSLVALTLASPILLLAAILVKLTSRGPVFFAQERVGLDRRHDDRRNSGDVFGADQRRKQRRVLINFGKPFTIYKLRTMVADAESPGRPMWAKKADPRITGIGRVLRMTRIDELPQFVNVLQGQMSIVGPRPERQYFMGKIEKDLPEFQLRLRTKPGITGLAQVELGYTNSDEGLRDKLQFDLEYIRRLNAWTDFKILFKTVFVVITGKGAC